MKTEKENAAGMLDTSEAAHRFSIRAASLSPAFDLIKPTGKQLETAKAEFALLGAVLRRSYRADDGAVSYVVTRLGGARYFTHWHDLEGHLNSLRGHRHANNA